MSSHLRTLLFCLTAATGAHAQGVPPTFTCAQQHYGSNDGCDCGCGITEPDCDTPLVLDGCAYDGCSGDQVPSAVDPTVCVDGGCGDGYRGANEACDDGDVVDSGGCSADCTQVTPGFLCGVATAGCQVERCGDGIRTSSENCDDANNSNLDGCSETCVDEPGFICFDGVPCRRTTCGDFWVEFDFTTHSGETCDDGNVQAGDGCSSTCEEEPGFFCQQFGGGCIQTICGDGLVQGDPFSGLGETCEDGNLQNGDGCDGECHAEAGFLCWNGPCHIPGCGDGIVDNDGFSVTEQCDDGNALSGDGCSNVCFLEPGFDCFSRPPGEACIEIVCGDGVVTQNGFAFEACDDGNAVSNDGCSDNCQLVEQGFVCPTQGGPCRTPVCGDGLRDVAPFNEFQSEECDDGDVSSGDGCSAVCERESGFECPTSGEACVPLPPGWICALAFFAADDGCDCGCGIVDPDCANPALSSCTFNHCFDAQITAIDPCDTTRCLRPEEAAAVDVSTCSGPEPDPSEPDTTDPNVTLQGGNCNSAGDPALWWLVLASCLRAAPSRRRVRG